MPSVPHEDEKNSTPALFFSVSGAVSMGPTETNTPLRNAMGGRAEQTGGDRTYHNNLGCHQRRMEERGEADNAVDVEDGDVARHPAMGEHHTVSGLEPGRRPVVASTSLRRGARTVTECKRLDAAWSVCHRNRRTSSGKQSTLHSGFIVCTLRIIRGGRFRLRN